MLEIEAFDEETVNALRSRARMTTALAKEEQVEHSIEDLLKIEGNGERTKQLTKTHSPRFA